MDNNITPQTFHPEDEYAPLESDTDAAVSQTETEPDDAELTLSEPQPAPQTSAPEQPAQPVQDPAAQPAQPQPGTIPYYTYPMIFPMPGMLYPPQGAQQPNGQPFTPMQGMGYPDYMQYYMPQYQQPGAQQPNGQPQMPQPQMPPMPPYGPYAPPLQNASPQPAQPDSAESTSDEPDNEKRPASAGTVAYLIILTALLLAMIGGFIAYIVSASNKSADSVSKSEDSSSENQNGIIVNPNSGDDQKEVKHTELEEEITLVADDGATQTRDTDNPDSVGKPDKNAAEVELKAQPKDKDDAKYTAKSSFNSLADSVVTIACYQDKITDNYYDIKAQGSGVIISADGYIVTNAHVLNNSKEFVVNVTLNNGEKHQAKIIGYDTWSDLAVIKIDAKKLKPAEFGDSSKVAVGDEVIAIGSPGGAKYQNSLTQGVISAVDREISINKCVKYIQSDAAINPGSSGGPLCNLYGQVIGITTAKTIAENYENMCFSIPSATAKDVITDLIRYGYVTDRARIGFTGNVVSQEYQYYMGIPAGVVVGEIAEDGALADSDVKTNDIITAIDGEKISSFQDIYNILSRHKKGDKITLSIYRVDEKLDLNTDQ